MFSNNCRSRVAEHQYDAITSARQFAEKLQSDLRAVSKDQHLELDYSYQPIPLQSEDQQEKIDPEREARIRYRGGLVNYWFKNADILSRNIGYLRFDGFHSRMAGTTLPIPQWPSCNTQAP
jgi:retinol-binding protein 3